MNFDYISTCLNEHTQNICTIFNALSRQTTLNKLLLLGGGYLAYKVVRLSRENKARDERIDKLSCEIKKMKLEKETRECNA